MRGSWRTRVGAVVAAVALAIVALLGGVAQRPAPVSAAYCDDYPFLCTTYVVTPSGNGSGTVTTADGFINCRSVAGATSGSCSHRYVEDENGSIHITLTLTADAGDFACFKTQCAADTQTQTFGASSTTGTYTDGYPAFRHEDCAAYTDLCRSLTLEHLGDGSGNVRTGDGHIDCDHNPGSVGECSYRFFTGNYGEPPRIYVVGAAAPGSEVCEDGSCDATQDFYTQLYGDSTFTFTFRLLAYDVTVARAGTGSGRVVSSPGGIDCGSDCTGTWTYGASVTLSAAANAGSTFASWSGACAGQDATCNLTVAGASTSTATFVKAGTTAPPEPTKPPGATLQPTPGSAATVAPGSTSGASQTPGAPSDGSAPPAEPSAAGVTATPTDEGAASPLPGSGVPSDERGPDMALLALAILAGAVIIAIGLAVGLRGRRPPSGDPPPA